MSKFMNAVDFAEWASCHTAAETEQRAIELQSQLREELLDSGGNTLDEYAMAPRDGRQMMEEAGGQVWITEEANREAAETAASDEQADIQQRLCDLHPQHFPSAMNGQMFLDAYVEQFREAHPDITHVFWDFDAMEAVYQGLLASGAFEVERVYKQ
jgi:hypothetical protein